MGTRRKKAGETGVDVKNTGHRTQHYSYWFDIRNLLGFESLVDLDLNFVLAFS